MSETPRVMVAIPTAKWGASCFRPFDDILSQFQKRHPEVEIRWAMSGVVPGARNRLVRMALQEQFDYIWWLDDDQPFAIDDFDKLMAHRLDAVLPLSPRRGAPFMPLIYDSVTDDWNARQHWMAPGEHGLIKIAGGGMAGLLITTECFRKIGTDGWFEFVHTPGNYDDYSEDFPFYRKLEKVGVQLYCDLEVRFGHAVQSVAYIIRQGGKWVTVLADHDPFVAFPQLENPDKSRIIRPNVKMVEV